MGNKILISCYSETALYMYLSNSTRCTIGLKLQMFAGLSTFPV